MSLWSSLLASTAWPTDLASLAGPVVPSLAHVYGGRKPRAVCNRTGEIWLEPLPMYRTNSGLQHVLVLPVNVHVRWPSNPGVDGAGTAQLTEVDPKLQTILAAYKGTRRMVAITGLTDVIFTDAEVVEVDDDPDVLDVLDGVVRVTWFSRE